MDMTEEDVTRIYAALGSEIYSKLGITRAGAMYRAAGLLPPGDQHWNPFFNALDTQFRKLSFDEKLRAVRLIAQRLMEEGQHHPTLREGIQKLLRAHGFQFIDDAFVPIGLFDEREARVLPEASVAELTTALNRLVDARPDLDGGYSRLRCGRGGSIGGV